MILQIVVIRDIKANCYAQPYYATSIGAVIRGFGDEVNKQDEQNMLYKHPEDFELYRLGDYDDSNAKFNLLDQPQQLAVGSDMVIKR